MSEKKSSKAFMLGFIVGAIGGAAYTILQTPQSGDETLAQLRGLKDRFTGGGSAASDWTNTGYTAPRAWERATDNMTQQAEKAADTVKSAAQDIADEASWQAEDAVEQAKSAVRKAEKKAQDLADDLDL